MSTMTRWLFVCAALVGWTGCTQPKAAPPPPPTPEVIVTQPDRKQYTPFAEFTGRLEASESIAIRAQVTGYLTEIHFKDGELVKKGDPLFQIDARTYRAEVTKAAASIKQAAARLERAEKQFDRLKRLMTTGAASDTEFEQADADRKEAAATLELARANHNVAELNLGFTSVVAPIDGRISRRLVDAGNLVQADQTILAYIVQSDPIYAFFEMDERTVLALRRNLASSSAPSLMEQRLDVDLLLADETEPSLQGTIDFTDYQLDAQTGTLRVRAVVENPRLLLTPGFFIRCRMPLGESRQAVCVPEEALGSDQGQRFIYVLDKDDQVVYRRVDTGPLLGNWRVIEGSVTAEERVIVAGLQRVRPGQKVAPKLDLEYGRKDTAQARLE